jgi:hypothetical protein
MDQSTTQKTTMSTEELYREESFTDRRVGTIKRLTPVTPEGEPDSSRATIYSGETQIMLGNNPLPIHFDINAESLGEAADKFADEAHKAAENTIKRLKEMQREMASKIVVPGQGSMPSGGIPGGGNIQLP